MEQLRFRDFFVGVDINHISLKDLKGGEIKLTPGEIGRAKELVGTVWKMTSLPAMPNRITTGEDMYCAIEEDMAEFRKEDMPSGNVGFRFPISDCDFVVDALDLGLNKSKDMTKLDPQPRATGTYNYGGPGDGDIIEGKV